ncbi:LysM peptidoglycan-binding domain-containing protein [Bacteroidota bacterium]
MKKYFVIVLLFSITLTSSGQVDMLYKMQDSIEMILIREPIDKLMKMWYLKKLSKDTNTSSLNIYGFKYGQIPSYPDSVYEKRLDDLQSVIPLGYNPVIRRFIDLYTVKKRGQVETMLGLSGYYFPIFEEELVKQGMPLELKYIPVIESALNTHAVSKSGATGLWQFMYATARMYDLQITSYVDQRRDPYLLTEKAVTYFKDLYHVFDNWLFVIAAYNCGPGSLNKAITQSGYKSDFWEVYPYLPQETRGYIPAFIGAAYAMNYYAEHNLYPKNIYNPGLLDTIQIRRRLRLDVVANAMQMDLGLLKELNPQYIKDVIPQSPTGQPYILRLPFDKASMFYVHRDRIYRYQDYLDQKEKDASAVKKVNNINSFPSQNTNTYSLIKYTVKSGDKLSQIAEWFECTEKDLARWNEGIGSSLYAGKVIQIYVPSHKSEHYSKINAMSFQEKQEMVGKAKEAITGEIVYYTVKVGDTLWAIARLFPGVTPNEIMQLNQIDEQSIKPGQTIKIQKK